MSSVTEDYTADQLDALWVSYQTQGGALCPYCEHPLTLTLAEDSETTGEAPVITVDCPVAGGTARTTPANATRRSKTPSSPA